MVSQVTASVSHVTDSPSPVVNVAGALLIGGGGSQEPEGALGPEPSTLNPEP
jgi:hypothetical protein